MVGVDLKLVGQFPTAILEGCESALCLFAGEGEHEVKHLTGLGFVRAVDNDMEKLTKLKSDFPLVEITRTDIFKLLDRMQIVEGGLKWSLVVCDQFTGDDFELWGHYDKLKSLANKYLLISVCQKSLDEGLKLPEGELIKRSNWLGGVYWHLTKI